ncbi:MAG: hypothetical protein K2P70_08075 [Hyphomonadaceae bacterium]|nr:hypothetical protein [Hyphomonadaceae bacterium]
MLKLSGVSAMDVHATTECFICEKTLKMGHHRFEGFGITDWGVTVCTSCKKHTTDGVVETPELLERMREAGIAPSYNSKGHIIIPR